MTIEEVSIAEWVALIVALCSLWVSVRAFNKSKNNELFQLRQRVLLDAEKARSAWYSLNQENNSLIHQVEIDLKLLPDLKKIILEFLYGQKEHLANCIFDAVAMAEDIQKNVGKFDEKKCVYYLHLIEPSLEKLERSKGVSERKMSELLEKAYLANQP